MAKLPVRLREQQHRLPEEGRIRFGIRDDKRKGAPKAIPWFRFTSRDPEAIAALAALYGGRVKDWQDGYKQAAFEVVTEASDIRIVLPPDPLTQWYEKWGGSGCERRCDGAVCTIPRGMGGPDPEPVEADCLCEAERALSCTPKSRLSVVLPDLAPFRGVWRLETGGDHARQELPAMVAAVAEAQGRGMTFGILSLQKRSEFRWDERTQKQMLVHYVTPVVGVAASFDALLAGGARARALGPADVRLALPAGETLGQTMAREADAMRRLDPVPDDDIVDAEVVEDALSDLDPEPTDPPPWRDPDAGEARFEGPPPGFEDPDTTDQVVEDEMKFLRQRCAMAVPDAETRHAMVRWVSKGRTATSTELHLEELRRLREGCEKVRRGELTVRLVDGEATFEKAAS